MLTLTIKLIVKINARITPITVSEGDVASFLSKILAGKTNKASGRTVAKATLAKKMKEKKSLFFINNSLGKISKTKRKINDLEIDYC